MNYKYLAYIILYTILWISNLYIHIFVYRKLNIPQNNINFLLWVFDIFLPIIIGIYIYLLMKDFKFRDKIGEVGFSQIFISILLFYFIINNSLMNLNINENIKNTINYKILSNYPFISTIVLILSIYFIEISSCLNFL